jgi:small conductance mechanosensitive channel
MNSISEALQNLLTNAVLFLPKLVAALAIFVIALVIAGLLSRTVRRQLKRREVDSELTLLIGQITRWGVITLGITFALQQVDFDLSAFLTGLGILGFTIGFAIQDVSKNFVAGLLLLLQQPFDIGDTVEVAGFGGTVLTIDLRATVLRTFDGKHLLVPNADVFTNAIINYSQTPRRRIQLTVGVAYGSDLETVEATALATIAGIEGVLRDPAPAVVFDNFGESSVDFSLYYWVDSNLPGVWGGTNTGVKSIKLAFEEANIDMPYPIRVVQMMSSQSDVGTGDKA